MDKTDNTELEHAAHKAFGQINDFILETQAARYPYERVEKDLSLTPDDIKKIVDIYDECLSLTFEEGKPAYESEEFYQEVFNRFLKTKEK